MKGWILRSAIGWAAIFASQFVLSVPARQTEKDREVTVKLDAALDVRSSPSLSSKRLGTIRAGQAVTINVLANDSANGGTLDPATVTVTGAPASGTATVPLMRHPRVSLAENCPFASIVMVIA